MMTLLMAFASAGVHKVTFHELRHTFGTQMAAAGAPLRAIQEWLGHADAKTSEIYAHYAPDATNGAAFAERAFAATLTSGLPSVMENQRTHNPSVPGSSPGRPTNSQAVCGAYGRRSASGGQGFGQGPGAKVPREGPQTDRRATHLEPR